MSSSTVRHFAVIAVAVAGAFLVWAVAMLADVELALNDNGPADEVRLVDILSTTVVAGLAAWAVHWPFARAGHDRWWLLVSTAVLVVSLTGPISYADSGSAAAALIAMHLVVGITLIVGFPLIEAGWMAERRAAQSGHPARDMPS